MPLSTSFLFHDGLFLASYALGCGIFKLLPIFTRFQPFLPIFHPSFLYTMGTREGRDDLAMLISPHHRDPVKAGVNMWLGGPNGLHQSVRVLLHFTQFCTRRYVRYPPYGPWDHVPPHVWIDKSNSAATKDEGEDEADVCVCCVLCFQARSTITFCGEYQGALVGIKLFISQYMMDTDGC